MTSRWGEVEERVPQPSIRTMATDWDEEELARDNMYDDPQPYKVKPARRERANEELPRTDGRQSQLNAWSEEKWRDGQMSWRVAII